MIRELLIHRGAEFEVEQYLDHFVFKLTNKNTNVTSLKEYWFLDEGITLKELTKIEIIIQFMHQDIGLDYFDNEKLLIIDNKE